jgi:hypothetical protein
MPMTKATFEHTVSALKPQIAHPLEPTEIQMESTVFCIFLSSVEVKDVMKNDNLQKYNKEN